VIDSKNTLQSFDAHPSSVPPAIAPDVPMHPMLPGGAMITGKNTLQNFDSEGLGNQPTPISPAIDLQDDRKRSPDEPPISAITTTDSLQTAVAVAVDADIVYGEVATEPVNQTVTVEPTTPWYKRQSTFAFLTIISLLLAVVLGFSIGLSGNGTPSIEPFKSGDSLPTSAPSAVVPMNATITTEPNMTPIAINPNITLRAAVLTSYINNITLLNQKITANGTTPESKALSWLIYNDSFLETAALISEDDPIRKNAIGFRIRQRYALLTMWFQQNATTKWENDAEWLVNPSECHWYGISCKPLYVEYSDHNDDDYFFDDSYGGSYGGSQNVVIRITFNLLGSYVGVIPYDIGLLTTLEHFEIQNTIDISNTDNERYLLSSLPDSIGQWTALTYFDVSGNALTGTLPNSIGQWTSLTSFDVSYNFALRGTLPYSVGQWNDLTHFDAPLNVFTGTVPSSIGNWTALTYFDVRGNFLLNGTLPASIGKWTALTHFDVSHNSLNGTIPSSIGNWSLVEYADFTGNQFVGTMPNATCQYIDPNPDALCADVTVNCFCCTNDCTE
jgi:hypothetical protein